MSDFRTPTSGDVAMQPKQISHRLLNMKFMQRASASSKDASSPSTPSFERHAKRRRTGDFASTINQLNTPSTPSSAVNTPTHDTKPSLTNGESTQRGTNNFDSPGIETEWVLNVRIHSTNGGNLSSYESSSDDNDDDDDEESEIWSSTAPPGRQTYGSFNNNNKKKKANTGASTATGATPGGSVSKKRNGAEDSDEDEELSALSSASGSDRGSEGEEDEPPRMKKKNGKGAFDFRSEADLKRMDNMDFRKAGFDGGLGRQRQGLSGGGGGGGGHGQRRDRKKARKTM